MATRASTYNASALDEYANQLAGQIYTPDEQCEIIDGPGSYFCRVSGRTTSYIQKQQTMRADKPRVVAS